MEQSLGYVAQGEDRVCKLKKAIYGLKQSPRTSFEKFSKVVMAGVSEMCCCAVDHSIFYRKIACRCVLLTVYVDDILVIDSNKESIEEIKEHLKTHFITKDMEKPMYFLGIEFAYANRKNSAILEEVCL